MGDIRKEVLEKIGALITLLEPNCDPDTRVFVHNKLTSMSILGTLPPGSRKTSTNKGSIKKPNSEIDDRSQSKTNWIEVGDNVYLLGARGISMKPLFMWAGGKSRMLKKYAPYLPTTFDTYIEPFFGGGAMFVWAYTTNRTASFIINDSNEGIMSIYREIRDNVSKFQARLDELESQYLPLDKASRKVWYYALRDEHAYDYQKWTKAEESATLYFLMKTSFNGIWQINKNTNGRFGTPFGLGNHTTTVYDRSVLKWWNTSLQNVVILCQDFETVVKNHATNNAFVYMDPPYRGCFTHYNTALSDTEHSRIVRCLYHCETVGATGLLSGRDLGDSFFENQWHTNRIKYFDVTYTAGRRKKTKYGFKAKSAREVLLTTGVP